MIAIFKRKELKNGKKDVLFVFSRLQVFFFPKANLFGFPLLRAQEI